MNPETIKKDFPIFGRKIQGNKLVYLDNAATSQKPKRVIDAELDFYRNHNANIHRSIHTLGEEATALYEKAHESVAEFINASHEEIIFTKNVTESLNLLAYSLGNQIQKGDEIVITQMEHHSNLVPWQQLALRKKATLRYIKIKKDGTLDKDSIDKTITRKTRVVSFTNVSNVLGTVNDVKKIIKRAQEANAYSIIDAAQAAPHMRIDAKKLDADFIGFTGHKMLGPTGIGVLFGKKHILEKMDPFLYGGEMIQHVSFSDSKWNSLPWKFEAGTMNIAQAIGLGSAIGYLKKIGMNNIVNHDKALVAYAMKKLNEIEDLHILGPLAEKRLSLISFTLGKIHAHDIAAVLDREGVAVRAGHHCAMPLHELLGIQSSVRASFYVYNTKEDADKLCDGLLKVKKVFN